MQYDSYVTMEFIIVYFMFGRAAGRVGGGCGRDLELLLGDVNYCVTLPCTTGRNVLPSAECDRQQGK